MIKNSNTMILIIQRLEEIGLKLQGLREITIILGITKSQLLKTIILRTL